mmetsp:Transcript_13456/g.23885  ORF Transcript_13456/g.23885 Transcript_13456/m.23885 type:complete len:133 (+) Transcript_13456:102-500(+)
MPQVDHKAMSKKNLISKEMKEGQVRAKSRTAASRLVLKKEGKQIEGISQIKARDQNANKSKFSCVEDVAIPPPPPGLPLLLLSIKTHSAARPVRPRRSGTAWTRRTEPPAARALPRAPKGALFDRRCRRRAR